MSIVVTGATGHLGRFVVESLLARGVGPSDITAAGRSIDKLADLAERGVVVAQVDFTDAASLDAAFTGAEKVLLVSGVEPDRIAQHQNVIDAAVRAGVAHLVYTSAPNAVESTLLLTADHRSTEAGIAASGLPFTILRNSWYIENYTGQLPSLLEHGMFGAAGAGRVSVALRREYADAAAAVLAGTGHEGAVYELGGQGVTLPEIAAAIATTTGTPVPYTEVSIDQLRDAMIGAGLPDFVATMLADVDRGIALGELETSPKVLESLIGHPVTALQPAVDEAIAALEA